MLIIGVDLSLRGTAIAVVNEHKDIVETKRFVSNPRKLDGDRIDALLSDVTEFIANVCKAQDARLFIEGYAMGARVGKSYTRSEYAGIFKHILRLSNLHYWLVTPTALKLHTTGKGAWRGKSEIKKGVSKSKEMMMAAVAEKYGFIAMDDDTADAVALAMYGYAIIHEGAVHLPWISESVEMS